jgi:hypothetical protein
MATRGRSNLNPFASSQVSHRLLCHAGTTRRSLWLDDLTGLYPYLKDRNVVLDPPVKLTGQALCS